MPDKEKVINGLREMSCRATWKDIDRIRDKFQPIINNALALLKEQEAVKPIAKKDGTYECICGAIVGWDELDASGIVQTRFNYCPYCGKAVKWG